MQATKDSFYVALRTRLAAANPQRTVTIDGASRPGIVVVENERPVSGPAACDVFYLHWGSVKTLPMPGSTLCAMECTISYSTAGTSANGGEDRGRMLAAMDSDLLAIVAPRQTAKCDYGNGTGFALGSTLFWTQPVLSEAAGESPVYAGRKAALIVYFYPEVNQQ